MGSQMQGADRCLYMVLPFQFPGGSTAPPPSSRWRSRRSRSRLFEAGRRALFRELVLELVVACQILNAKQATSQMPHVKPRAESTRRIEMSQLESKRKSREL